MNFDDLISFTPRVEVYIDLHGFSVNWIETICDKIHELYRSAAQDSCESYHCYESGGLGVRFITDAIYAETVRSKARQLLALAASTYDAKSLYIPKGS